MSGATFQMSQYDPSRTYLQDTLYPLQREESVQVEMPFSESNKLTQGKQQNPSNLNEEQKAKGILEYYLQSATIHGISQTSGPQHYFLRRLIWLILLAVMTISLVWAVYGQINSLYEYPIKTVTQVTLNTVLPFPAVTICNLNQFMRDRVPDIPIVVKVIQQQSEYFQSVARMKNQSDNMFDLENLTDVSGEELQRILFNAAPRLDELFRGCSWQGDRYDCNDLFKTDVTGHGICYTFNGPDLKPEQRYKAVGPISLLRTQVILGNNRSYYARYPYAGIKVLLNRPGEIEHPQYGGWSIRPGVAASMALSRSDSKCLPKPFKAFTNDYCEDTKVDGYRNRLTLYNTYTVVHCYRECVYKRLEYLCNCRFYLSPAQIEVEDLFQCSCPRECEDIDYSADISYANIFSQFIEAQAIKDGILLLNNSLRDNLIDLSIFYKSLNVVKIVQEPAMSFASVMGNLGGQMGLFLGAIILSITELIELLLLLVLKAAKRCTSWISHRCSVNPAAFVYKN
ncbi:acid-sensing ion channel 1 [Plakobranchus ocellatus]|uniref:Acid-sensing ion channel 1 n=1 Tax=Plakobranchus ocellatus TaxID=259542 RepID=A0AAV4AUV5_9GAST|nr:acid-sensing ion channel 1 [Plakobranchus ocellatus]